MAELSLLRSRLFEQHGLVGLFTLRKGGVSPSPFDSFNFGSDLGDPEINVRRNLELLMQRADLAELPHQVRQVHGAEIYLCEGPGRMHEIEADILTSRQPATALAVRTADCLPILLADPVAGIAAAVHAGWRGTAANAANKGVVALTEMGGKPERMIAALGPCIGPCCFTIGTETAEQLAGCCQDAHKWVTNDSGLTANIRALNHQQLLQSGLEQAHIESLGACTACQPDRFYSYRRDGKNSGRHLAVVALPSTP